mgnify:FL=1
MILFSYGTRPEWIKIKPLIEALSDEGRPYHVLFTGQHKDLISGNTHDFIIDIEEGKNRLDSVFKSIMDSIDFSPYTKVLVQGDTASAAAVALSAFNHNCPVVHLEAGLRTYNLQHPYPEEAYRQIISRIASLHLCPTTLAKNRLIREIVSGKIEVVGNTVLDNLVGLETSYGDEVLITMHRRENHDLMSEWVKEFELLPSLGLNVTVIRHPNPNVKKALENVKNINVIDPLSHDEMMQRLAHCKFIITDSGGLQEEGSFLGKKIIVCRETTERSEALVAHSVLCKRPSGLFNICRIVDSDYIVSEPCPFGDGSATEKIMELL